MGHSGFYVMKDLRGEAQLEVQLEHYYDGPLEPGAELCV